MPASSPQISLSRRSRPHSLAVIVVVVGILRAVALVIFLGRIERARGFDFHRDHAEPLFHFLLRRFRGHPLRFVVIENLGTILVPVIAELAIALGRIDVVPVDLQQRFVAHLRRVELHLLRLGVPRLSGAHVAVRRDSSWCRPCSPTWSRARPSHRHTATPCTRSNPRRRSQSRFSSCRQHARARPSPKRRRLQQPGKSTGTAFSWFLHVLWILCPPRFLPQRRIASHGWSAPP